MLRRFFLFSVLFGLLALPSSGVSASPQTQLAVGWIIAQQQSDGGFEMAGFPGFETPDAVLAIAENAQTDTVWSAAGARSAVEAVQFGGSGPTPLDYLDDLAESTPTAGTAAKLIVLDVLPLGFDPNDFDPSGDSLAPVNLVSILDAGCGANTASFGFLADTLYAVLAKSLVCGSAPPAAISTIKAAQQSNGGWGWAGDPNGTDLDVDMTSLAIQALVAGGADVTDAAVKGGLKMLAGALNTDGSWEAFGNSDPNSTSMGILALKSTGYEPADSCWRDLYAPGRSGTGYADPSVWLLSQQQLDGRIVSPNDGWGINSIATSQSVRALTARWTPVAPRPPKECPVSTEFLAEGSTGPGFETWVLIANPSETETVAARTSFLTSTGQVPGGAVELAPLSRYSIKANDFVSDWNVSAQVEGLNGRVVAERAVYSTGAGRTGAHLGQGLSTPAAQWFLAEGSTGPGFETWILVANPEAITAEVTVSLLTSAGPGPDVMFSLAPGTRRSVRANDYVIDWGVSARVVSTGAGVAAERATYVAGDSRKGATDSPGSPTGTNEWFLAEGSTGPGFETWILVANPDTITAEVEVGFMTGSGPGPSVTFTLPPGTRHSLRANDHVTDWEVSSRVSSTGGKVVAERSVYTSTGSRLGQTAASAEAVESGANEWFLAEGSTGPGFETWILVANPDTITAEVEVGFVTGSGPGPNAAFTLPPGTRQSIRANDFVPGTWEVAARVRSAGGAVVAEHAIYTPQHLTGDATAGPGAAL